MAGMQEYRARMHHAAKIGTPSAWYDQLDARMLLKLAHEEARGNRLSRQEVQTAERRVAQAQTRDSIRVFAKRPREVDGELRIVADPPLIVPIEDLVVPGSIGRIRPC
jgi:hypothetical protein